MLGGLDESDAVSKVNTADFSADLDFEKGKCSCGTSTSF
jgi:hypothetical protein